MEVVADPVALHRHGLELPTAWNRLALAWLGEAQAQHAAMTRRALESMLATTRDLAEAEGGAAQARILLEALGRAQAAGLAPAEEITARMRRIQSDSLAPPGGAPASAGDAAGEAVVGSAADCTGRTARL